MFKSSKVLIFGHPITEPPGIIDLIILFGVAFFFNIPVAHIHGGEITSGAIDARPGINNNKALHTIAVYNNNFQGAFKVQGTMASSPSNEDFFDITLDGESETTVDFPLPETKVVDFNFTGVYHSVRFCWDNGSGMDPDNTGKIDKILYRQ